MLISAFVLASVVVINSVGFCLLDPRVLIRVVEPASVVVAAVVLNFVD